MYTRIHNSNENNILAFYLYTMRLLSIFYKKDVTDTAKTTDDNCIDIATTNIERKTITTFYAVADCLYHHKPLCRS